jgi:hypothetical protein
MPSSRNGDESEIRLSQAVITASGDSPKTTTTEK